MSIGSVGEGGTLHAPTNRHWTLQDTTGYVPCPRCGAKYPPGYQGHTARCPKRPLSQTVRNLARMYVLRARGKGCAAYIRKHEWLHLLRLLRA